MQKNNTIMGSNITRQQKRKKARQQAKGLARAVALRHKGVAREDRRAMSFKVMKKETPSNSPPN